MFLSRGDRDHGDAFQTHPVSQASARGEAKDADILLGRNRYLLEPTEWPPGSQASCGVGERTRDCSPGHAGKEGPQLVMKGESQGFPRAAALAQDGLEDAQERLGELLLQVVLRVDGQAVLQYEQGVLWADQGAITPGNAVEGPRRG